MSCGLAKQLSRLSHCSSEHPVNATFGCTSDQVWVRHGCRGEFLCGGRQVPCGFQHQLTTNRYHCACGNISAVSTTGGALLLQRPPQLELVHIPKTGGSSLRQSLNEELGADLQHFGRGGTGPRPSAGDENCLHDTRASHFRISLFRRPRSHVFSQYLECRSGWFLKAKPEEIIGDFPRNRSVVEDFGAWLGVFLTDARHHAYNCYSPLNMQARALTCCRGPQCGNHDSHLVTSEPTPRLESASAALRELDVVGLTERYSETLCLITHRLGRVVPSSCFCDDDGQRRATPKLKQRSSAHVSVEALPAALLPAIDALTTIDQPLYDAASARFVDDVRSMERDLGRGRVLCEDVTVH